MMRIIVFIILGYIYIYILSFMKTFHIITRIIIYKLTKNKLTKQINKKNS